MGKCTLDGGIAHDEEQVLDGIKRALKSVLEVLLGVPVEGRLNCFKTLDNALSVDKHNNYYKLGQH